MTWLLYLALSAPAGPRASAPLEAEAPAEAPRGTAFLGLLHTDPRVVRRSRREVLGSFAPADVAMALEVLRFLGDPELAAAVWRWLEQGTGETFERDHDAAFRWLWARDVAPHPDYAMFKASLYRGIDPRFAAYFQHTGDARIRLDEIRWGGVKQNGIPPLREPFMEPAGDASWLADTDVVFGVELEGDARAYPKRILAWHELFTDTIGGVAVAGVYCTLCGSMIVYETAGHTLGTSGFLYRSNKLMFDEGTMSLWSTLGGTPVVGPLADEGIELPMRPVVTTTWGRWRRLHPDTSVLSLNTGHERNYGEGVAYRAYFATDALMFAVPDDDPRLENKDEVLGLRLGGDPVALSAAFLRAHPVHHETVGGTRVVILTDGSGANRVYEAGALEFSGDPEAPEAAGEPWTVTESALLQGEQRLSRVPAHRAFWFGWRAAWPETRLVM